MIGAFFVRQEKVSFGKGDHQLAQNTYLRTKNDG